MGGALGLRPNLEPVRACDGQSFRAWSHEHSCQSVRWHCYPEFELHLVTATKGDRCVGDHIGSFCADALILIGPNLPHNWISDVSKGEVVEDCCLIFQFTGEFIAAGMAAFPELRFVQPLLDKAFWGVRFNAGVAGCIEPLMRDLLEASDARRGAPLAGIPPTPAAYLSPTMNLVLRHVARDLSGTDLAKLSGQSVSTFSHSFRKHAGMTLVQHVSSLRIGLACQHLSQADLTISDVCRAVGFNVSSFNRRFLAAKGMPPSKVRTRRRDRRRFASAA